VVLEPNEEVAAAAVTRPVARKTSRRDGAADFFPNMRFSRVRFVWPSSTRMFGRSATIAVVADHLAGSSTDRHRIYRRTDRAGNRQRRANKHKVVNLVAQAG